MFELGKYNELKIIKITSIGIYLGDENEQILLPNRYVPENAEVGDSLKVFVYLDNENRPIATTLKPLATVNQFVYLIVKELNNHGAFLNWGIDRDLFLPYSEQKNDLKTGDKCLVYVFIDEISGRIAATTKWAGFLEENNGGLSVGKNVQLLIVRKTDMGYKAIIENKYEGMLYNNEIFEPLNEGELREGFIKQIRVDGKIDLTLQKQGYDHIIDTKQILIKTIVENGGVLKLGDKSSPEEIYNKLKISKKVFKKTAGALFREKKITVGDFEVRLSPGKSILK